MNNSFHFISLTEHDSVCISAIFIKIFLGAVQREPSACLATVRNSCPSREYFFSQEGCGYLHRNTMGEVIVQVRVRGLIQKGEQ